MDETTQQPETENAAESQGFLDKAKGILGNRKALLISVFVILFMGLSATAAWGVALAFFVRSIADPNGNSAQACFDKTFSDNWVITGPDVSKAVRTETRTFYVTSYCPPEVGNHPVEGGQWTSSNVHVGLGAVAVPPFNMSNPDITSNTPDYPWGTTFDIPGYGRGVAVDHGCAIQKAGVEPSCRSGNWSKTPNDHLDIFVGNGAAACNKWPTKSALQVKVYWFDPKQFPPRNVKDFVHAEQTNSTFGQSVNCGGTSSGPGVMYQANAYTAAQLDNYLRTNSPNSPLNGKGAAFVSAGQKYGVNPGFMLGIANAESSLGLQTLQQNNRLFGTNNAFGMMTKEGDRKVFVRYGSYEDGIDRATKNAAASWYKSLNGTMREFRLKWCGYETEVPAEAGHLPVPLSDGSKIDYPCSNGDSKWENEVSAIMKAL